MHARTNTQTPMTMGQLTPRLRLPSTQQRAVRQALPGARAAGGADGSAAKDQLYQSKLSLSNAREPGLAAVDATPRALLALESPVFAKDTGDRGWARASSQTGVDRDGARASNGEFVV